MSEEEMNWFENENIDSTVDIPKFEKLCKELFDQERVVTDLKAELKSEASTLEKMKSKVLAYLEAWNKDKYPVKGFGTLSILNRYSYKLPQGEKRKEFYDYLKKKGIFENLVTVNANTLNSFCKQEIEIARENNELPSIPGIGQGLLFKQLKVKKEK